MANYYEVTAIREYEHNGETKKSYTRLGVAFPFKDKDGFSVRLDAVPAPQDGAYSFMLFPPKPKDGQGNAPSNQNTSNEYANQSGGSSGASFGGDIDDSIPF